MTDLTEFVLSRIAEDEAAARRWQAAMDADENEPHSQGVPAWVVMAGGVAVPARVLAECAALRAVVEAHPLSTDPRRLVPVWTGNTPGVACETCGGDPADSSSPLEDIGPCDTLRALASIWAGHESYDPEWRLT